MKNWLSKLNIFLKTCFVSTIVFLVLGLIFIVFFFVNLPGIALSLYIGSLISILFYLIFGLIAAKEQQRLILRGTIILTIFRFIIIAGLICLFSYLSFVLNNPFFNVFSLIGGFSIPLIVLLIILLVRKNGDI